MTLLHAYSEFARQQAADDMEPEVLHHAKRAVIDWLAALYPGTRCAPSPQLVAAHRDELGSGRSSVVGFGSTAFPATAAWINGSVSHAIEYDDSFRDAVFHPGCPTIAAALAIAEDRDCSGKDLLSAIVVGYEISTRLGAALQPSHARMFHATGTIGCLAGAASAAVLLCPTDATAIRHALATSASFASGLQQPLRSESMTKPLHAGNAASVGVRAAQAAAHGLTGAADVLEGPVGLAAAMAREPHWEVATEGLGVTYNITRVTHKVHACCGHQFVPIDAALELRARHAIHPEDIEAIEIVTYDDAIEATGNADPQTAYQAKFSLPFVVSHALVFGAVRLDAFDGEKLTHPAIRALMKRCRLRADPHMSSVFPGQRHAQMTITTRDGRDYSLLLEHRRGDPESPLSDDDLNAKYDELVEPVIGVRRARELRDRVWRLETLSARDLELATIPSIP